MVVAVTVDGAERENDLGEVMNAVSQYGGALPLPRLRGRAGVGALSTLGFAERAPTRLAEFIIGRRFAPTRWLGTLPRKRERGRKRIRLS
jgi:hypothetical protein